jgi:hypothetical protein
MCSAFIGFMIFLEYFGLVFSGEFSLVFFGFFGFSTLYIFFFDFKFEQEDINARTRGRLSWATAMYMWDSTFLLTEVVYG